MKISDLYKNRTIHPCSNGTEGMIWESNNCDSCRKNANTGQCQDTLEQYARQGRHCIYELAWGIAHIDGMINEQAAIEIGWTEEKGWPKQCNHYERGDYRGGNPPKKKPPKGPMEQLTLPFHGNELGSDLVRIERLKEESK